MLTEGSEVDPEMSAVIHLPGLTRGDSAGLALVVKWLAAAQPAAGYFDIPGCPKTSPALIFLTAILNVDHGLWRIFIQPMVFLSNWHYDLAPERLGRWALPTNEPAE